MFILILKLPSREITKKNISLINIATSYFIYLNYSTNTIFSFNLVKRITKSLLYSLCTLLLNKIY